MAKGGARTGAGRPTKELTRKQHQVRAYDDEWTIIKEFSVLVKKDIKLGEKALNAIKGECKYG